MNKKLWQVIGLERQSIDLCDFSEYSTIKVQQCLPLNDVSQDIHLFASETLKNNSLQNQNKIFNRAEEDLDIQSCESKQQSPKFRKVQPPFSETVEKIKIMRGSLPSLKSDYVSIKTTLQNWLKQFKKWAIVETEALIDKTSEFQRELKCFKCENNKKVIDTLTKQCWELESQLRQSNQQKQQLNELLKKQAPLKDIEEGLLEERGQVIIRLTAQVEELQEENTNLKISLSSMEQELNNVEKQYKSHLMNLKTSIEELNELASSKHEKLLQDKLKLEGQLQQLEQKYHNLLLDTDRSSKSKQRKKSRQRNGTFSYASLSGIHPIVSEIITPQNNAGPSLIHSKMRHRTEFVPYQSTQDLPRAKLDWKTTSEVHPLSLNIKCENVLNKYNLKRNNNKTYYEGSLKQGVTMKTALESLDDLKREVRREIKQSKRY